MDVCTIGFTQRSAASFFGAVKAAGVRQLIDVRLNNVSQLAGFSKRDDLAFFLREICDASYRHEPLLAPTQALLNGYRKEKRGWPSYERDFVALLAERRVEEQLPRDLFAVPSVLLCSEATPERCHRRLVAEYLRERWGGFTIRHLVP